MKRPVVVIAAIAVFCASLAAVPSTRDGQQPAQPPGNPSKAPGTILKNRAPVSKDVLKVSLPKPQETDLSNGVHVIVIEDHRAPQVFFQMIVDGAGGYYDPPAMRPHLVAVRDGHGQRPDEQSRHGPRADG